MQQATVNLFADMGAQPATLAVEPVAAAASTDTTAPTSTITSSPSVGDRRPVVDDQRHGDRRGRRRRRRRRGLDRRRRHLASGHVGHDELVLHLDRERRTRRPRRSASARPTTAATPRRPAPARPSTSTALLDLWSTGVTPPPDQADSGDATPVELGVKFRSDKFGTITGCASTRRPRTPARTSAACGPPTASGSRRRRSPTRRPPAGRPSRSRNPVEVEPNTTYVASYFAPQRPLLDHGRLLLAQSRARARTAARSPTARRSRAVQNTAERRHTKRRLRLRPARARSRRARTARPTTGSTSSSRPTPAPGAGHRRQRGRGRHHVGQRLLDGTVDRRRRRRRTRSRRTSARPRRRRRRSPARRRRRAPRSPASPPGTTYTLHASRRSTRTAAGPSPRRRTLSRRRARSRRRRRPARPPSRRRARPGSAGPPPAADGDSPITGYTVTPYVGATRADADPGQRHGHEHDDHRPHNGTSYTFRVTATNAVGASPASRPVDRRDAAGDDLRLRRARDGRQRRPERRRARREVQGRLRRPRSPASASTSPAANIGTHIGSLWTAGGQPTRAGDVHERDRLRAGRRPRSPRPVTVTAGTTYVASYFAPAGPLLGDRRRPGAGVDNGPLHAIANSAASPNGVYAYGATSTFPDEHATRRQLLGRRALRAAAPGQVDERRRRRRRRDLRRRSPGPRPRAAARSSSYRITPYIGGDRADADDVTGAPPTTSTVVTGLTTGTVVHVHGPGGQRQRRRRRVGRSPTRSRRRRRSLPSAPTDVAAQPGDQLGAGELDRARARRRQPDHGLHGHAVHRRRRPQTPVQVGASATSATVTGLDERDELHVQGHGDQRRRHRRAVGGLGRGHAARDDLRLRDAGDGRLRRSRRDRASASSSRADFPGQSPASASTRRRRTRARTSAACGRAGGTPAGTGDVHRRDAPPAGSRRRSRRPVDVTAGTTYVASYFAPNGHYSVTAEGLASARRQRPLQALVGNGTSRNGVYAYGSASAFPTQLVQAGNYWVDVLFAPAPGARAGDRTSTPPPARRSATCRWTAPASGGPVTSYKITPYIGATAQTPKTITGTPPATSTTITGLTAGHGVHVHGAGGQPGRRRAGLGAVQRRSRRWAPASPAAPTGVSAQADTQVRDRQLDRAGDDGGSAITGYTDHAVRRRARPSTPVQAGASATSARVPGLTNGTAYTFRVTATQRARAGPGLGRRRRRSPRGPRSSSSPRRPSSTPATTASVDLGVKFRSDVAGHDHRPALLQVGGQHRAPTSARLYSAGGDARWRQATFTGESASGWQTRHVREPGSRSPPARPTSPPTSRPAGSYSATGGGVLGRRDRQPAAARARERRRAQRCLRLQRDSDVPDQQLERDQLLGRRPVRPGGA